MSVLKFLAAYWLHRTKHMPGRHDQKLHGLWATGSGVSAMIESDTFTHGGVEYESAYSSGVRKSAARKAERLGPEFAVIRREGKYFVARASDAPPAPPVAGTPAEKLVELMPTDVKTRTRWETKMKRLDESGLIAEMEKDPEFAAYVKDLSGYTQGNFSSIREAGSHMQAGDLETFIAHKKAARTDEYKVAQGEYIRKRLVEMGHDTDFYYNPKLTQELVKEFTTQPIDPKYYEDPGGVMGEFRGGMYEFKSPAGGEYESDVLTMAGSARTAAKIHESLNASPPRDASIYRGFNTWERDVSRIAKQYEPGKQFTLGPTSFTDDAGVASRFAKGTAKGTLGPIDQSTHRAWVMTVQPGAKGVDINALSPYMQAEVLSSGTFEVVSIDTMGHWDTPSSIVVRQVDVPVLDVPQWAQEG